MSVTRQQRRAQERAAKRGRTGGGERVDPARLQGYLSARAKLDTARSALVAAQGAVEHAMAEIQERHALDAGDGFDTSTGLITRKPRRDRGR